MSRLDLEFARRFKAAAEARFPGDVEEVRLFGSRARGDAREDSDLDLFVLMRREDFALREALMHLAFDVYDTMRLPYVPSPHVMSRTHWEHIRSLEMRFARDILCEGIVV